MRQREEAHPSTLVPTGRWLEEITVVAKISLVLPPSTLSLPF